MESLYLDHNICRESFQDLWFQRYNKIMNEVVANILQQIDNEAAMQRRLSDDYTQKYNILRYYTSGNPFFSGVEKDLGKSNLNGYNSRRGNNMRPGNLGDLSDTWFGELGMGKGSRRGGRRGGRGHGRRRGRGRGRERRDERRAKKRAWREKARAAGWQKGRHRGRGRPCRGLRGWEKWRCRMQHAVGIAPAGPPMAPASTMAPPDPPEPNTSLLGLGFWGL